VIGEISERLNIDFRIAGRCCEHRSVSFGEQVVEVTDLADIPDWGVLTHPHRVVNLDIGPDFMKRAVDRVSKFGCSQQRLLQAVARSSGSPEYPHESRGSTWLR
jgi:hypothetical protein